MQPTKFVSKGKLASIGRFCVPMIVNKAMIFGMSAIAIIVLLAASFIYHIEFNVKVCVRDRAEIQTKLDSCDKKTGKEKEIWASECASAALKKSEWKGISCRAKEYDTRPWEFFSQKLSDAFSQIGRVQLLIQGISMLASLIAGGTYIKNHLAG